MEKHTVTVYIEGRSYQIAISVNDAVHETTYEIITSGNILKDFLPDTEEFIPEFINWQEDSMVMPDERIKLVESEQIARIIWTDILDMMEHWELTPNRLVCPVLSCLNNLYLFATPPGVGDSLCLNSINNLFKIRWQVSLPSRGIFGVARVWPVIRESMKTA